ncbi:MAG: hypothetical protein WDZ46_09360 [Solirubrobacterales bacterium]
MSFLAGTGLELGIGIAIGMLAGTTGTRGSARGRMTVLAAVIGLVAGYLLAGAAELSGLLGAAFCALGAMLGCVVISDLVSGASRRDGGRAGALGFLVSLVALIVVAAALLLPVVTLPAAAALAWLGVSRHRRAQRKHAGLRVLR